MKTQFDMCCPTSERHSFVDGRCNVCHQEERPPWPLIWMSLASNLALRSHDGQLKVGCVIVSEDNSTVLANGYNGNYRGGPHHRESTEPGKSGFLHAELNACLKCDFGYPKKKVMYVTHSPCRDCCKIVINSGIHRVVYEQQYRDTSGLELLRHSGISCLSLEELMASNVNV